MKVARILLAFLLAASIGGHWAVLQSLAWAGMLVNYTRNSTLATALSWTFDGQHPCWLCNLVKEGKSREAGADQKPGVIKPKPKLESSLAATAGFLDHPPLTRDFPQNPTSFRTRSESPPKPPPRRV